MSISVVCPNGHKLKAKEDLAGKHLRCPKCGARVLVPTPEVPVLDESAVLDGGSGMPSAEAPAPDTPPAADEAGDMGLPPLAALPPLDDLAALADALPPVDLTAAGDASPLGDLGALDELPADALLADAGPSPLGPAAAAPLRSLPSAPAPAGPRRWPSFPPLVWAAAGGGAVVGFVLVILTGWLLFGGRGAQPAAVATRNPPTGESPGPVVPAPTETAKPAQPQMPAAVPASPAPPAPAEKTAVPSVPPAPWDLVRINIDQRVNAFQLPGLTWAAAYDELTGRLAITHDEKGILVYAVEDVLAGKLGPRATIATDGLPTAVCLKALPDRRVWVIAGKNAPIVHVLDSQSLQELGTVAIDKAKYIDFLTGSTNPQDPFVYYSTHCHDNTLPPPKPERFGRINLVTLQPDGQTADRAPDIFDAAIPDDGQRIYCGVANSGVQVARWPAQRDSEGGVTLPAISSANTNEGGYVPAPDGPFVAVNMGLLSRNFWQTNMILDFLPKAFFRHRPLMLGVAPGVIVLGSTNDGRRVASVPLPPEWGREPGRPPPTDFRQRPGTAPMLRSYFLAAFADDQRQLGLLVVNQGLAVLPLVKLNLPDEKSLIVRNQLPASVAVGQEVTVELATDAEDVAFEWVGTKGKRDPPDARLLLKPEPVAVKGKQLTLAASVNAQQTEILLASLTPLAGLSPPLTVQIDDERMTLTAIDEFRTSIRVTRTAGSPHSVTATVLVPTGDEPAAVKPSLPTVEGRTFRWTPSTDQIGERSIRMRAKSGKSVFRWHWDVTVEPASAAAIPFYLTGIKPEPGGTRAVVWGQPAADSTVSGKLAPPTGKFFLGILDLATKQVIRQREVPRRILAATLHESGVYASLDLRDPEKPTQPTASRILRFRTEDLEVAGQVTTAEHGAELEVIAGRYLAAFSRWGETYRFTVPDLKPVTPELPMFRELRIAGRLQDGWLWDGVVWDQAMTTPRLLLFPVQFGAKPAQDGQRVLAGELGLIRLHTCGPYVCTWYQNEQVFHHGFSLLEYPGVAICEYGNLNLYSWEEGGKFTGDRDRVPDGKVALLPPQTLTQAQGQAQGYIADEAGIVYVALLGKLHAIPLEQLVPKKKDLFRFEERQSTFVLEADRPTKVQYAAPGAVRYDLQLQTMAPSPFPEPPTIQARSADGAFEIALDVNPQVLTNLTGGMAAVAEATADSPEARWTAYAKAVLPAFRALTGRTPRGVPFPVYAVVVAENAEGKKAGLAHAYLIEIPLARMRQFLGGRS